MSASGNGLLHMLKKTGPGIVVAAAGLGAGDIVASSVAGAMFGAELIWAVVIGAILKYFINEGVARWQLVTGKTLLEGWIEHLPRFVSWYFMAYLLLWSVMVAAALMAATGLAAHAMFPGLSVTAWGMVHSLLAVALVLLGGYVWLERVMKVFIAMMFLAVVATAVQVLPPLGEILDGLLIPEVPSNGLTYVVGVIGGVGGSVTIMSYGYWMREAGWHDVRHLPEVRFDLALAYSLAAFFGIGIMLVTAGIDPEVVDGNEMALAVADHLQGVVGEYGKWCFLVGFWGAAFSSMLGVWQGVPYLFANYVLRMRCNISFSVEQGITRSLPYRAYLGFLALPPMLLLWGLDRPVWIVVLYAVTGALFIPLVAGLLLYMNAQRRWLGAFISHWFTQLVLVAALLISLWLMVVEL